MGRGITLQRIGLLGGSGLVTGGGGGTVTTFFPLDTANGYANIGTSDVGDASPSSTGVINTQYVANRAQSYNSQDSNDELVIPAGSLPDATSMDWCFQLWAGIQNDSSINTVISFDDGASTDPGLILLDYDGSNNPRFVLRDDAATQYITDSGISVTDYVMYHWAIIRSGDTVYFMFDGTQVASHDVTGQTFDFSPNTGWALRRHFDSNNGVDGSVSEVHFTLGDAVYNPAGFTPPASPLSA